jgi:hypothetical protein
LSQVARSRARARTWIGRNVGGVGGGVYSESWETAVVGVTGRVMDVLLRGAGTTSVRSCTRNPSTYQVVSVTGCPNRYLYVELND